MSFASKFKNMPVSVKAAIAFSLSSIVIKGISFITTPIFTRIMDTEQYGVLATYNSWLSIIEVFAVLGFTSAGILNVALNDYKRTRNQLISSLLILSNIATLITFLLIYVIIQAFGNLFHLSSYLLMLMFIHFIFWPAQIFWLTRERYEYRYNLATLITISSAMLSQVLSIEAVLNINIDQALYKLWYGEIGLLIITIPIYFYILYKGKSYVDLRLWKTILLFALPLIPHYLAQHVMAGADRIMIGSLASLGDAGIYNVVSNISMISTVAWGALNSSLTPYMYDKLNIRDYTQLNVIVEFLLIGYAILCMLVCLIAPEVLVILAPPEYYGGIFAVPPIVDVAFISALYNIYAGIEFYYKKTKIIATATVIATLVNIIFNLILIPKYSYVGSSYATLISNVFLVAMHYYGYRKCSNNRVFEDFRIFKILIGVLIFNLISNIFYTYQTLRYIAIILLITILIINKKNIKEYMMILKNI